MPVTAKDACDQPIEEPESNDLTLLSQEQLRACVEVSKAITAELDPDKLIPTIMERISRLLPSETWSLLLLDDATQTLKFEISMNIDPLTVKDFRLALGQGVAGQAALRQHLLVVEDVSGCDFFFDQVDAATGRRTTALVCAPILYAGRTLGVLEVVNPLTIDPAGLAMLRLLADYLAIAIENTRRYQRMLASAVHDSLTGLFNQRYLYMNLQRHLDACRCGNRPLSLVFMDMDDFKQVVDLHGHLNGSRALSEVAQRIQACLPAPGFGVAYGGDEFVIVLPGFDRAQAVALAALIRQAIKETPYLIQWGPLVELTASFGVATFPEDADDSTCLLALADQAMFHVKNSGKDRVNANLKKKSARRKGQRLKVAKAEG
jgi:diguanylate cyclase (GGDEF)-like protein